MSGEHDPAHRLHDGDLREVLRPAPAVDRKGQRAAHPRVAVGLAGVVRGEEQRAVPVALLHRDLVAERVHEVVARLRREAPELDGGPVAADGLDAHRHLLGDDRLEPVEVRLPLAVVVVVSHPFHERAGLVLDELERAGPVHVVRVPAMAVLFQVLLAVDPVERRRERRQEGAGRELQVDHERGVVGRLDRLDHAEERLADTRHAFGREDEPVVGGLDVLGGHRGPVVERHPLLDLERVGLAAVGRLRHVTDAQVADEVRRLGILRIDPDQQAVERGVGVHDGVGGFPVSVLRRRFAGDDEFEGSTLLNLRRGHGLGAETESHRAAEQQRSDGPGSGARYVAFHL